MSVRALRAGGLLALVAGAAMLVPPAVVRISGQAATSVEIAVLLTSAVLVVAGMAALVGGFRAERTATMPSGVRAVLAANVLVLAFFALELSDRLVRRDGQIGYWSTYLLVPAGVLFGGVVAARRWAWWVSRGVAIVGVMWFGGFLLILPVAPLQAEGVPTPWYGRVYMAVVTIVFAGVGIAVYRALGRPDSRRYFGR